MYAMPIVDIHIVLSAPDVDFMWSSVLSALYARAKSVRRHLCISGEGRIHVWARADARVASLPPPSFLRASGSSVSFLPTFADRWTISMQNNFDKLASLASAKQLQ